MSRLEHFDESHRPLLPLYLTHSEMHTPDAMVIRIEAGTTVPRLEMIARISDAIQAANGFVMDSRYFSNTAVFIGFEIGPSMPPRLQTALSAAGLNFSSRSLDSIEQYADVSKSAAPGLRECHLSVTFFHNDPDLRIPVPAIPG